jgi:hypothetical protein
METKQSRMHEYMTSSEICRKMKSISKNNMDLITLQQKEEEEYQGLSKKGMYCCASQVMLAPFDPWAISI